MCLVFGPLGPPPKRNDSPILPSSYLVTNIMYENQCPKGAGRLLERLPNSGTRNADKKVDGSQVFDRIEQGKMEARTKREK